MCSKIFNIFDIKDFKAESDGYQNENGHRVTKLKTENGECVDIFHGQGVQNVLTNQIFLSERYCKKYIYLDYDNFLNMLEKIDKSDKTIDELRISIRKLSDKIDDLESAIKYIPNGEPYNEAKEEFDRLAKTKEEDLVSK